MKYAVILLALIACVSISSCSKKGAAAPVPHNIKVTVTGTADFTVTLSAIKADETISTALDTKTVTGGSYEFSTGLISGGLVHLEIKTSAANTVSYQITDNGAVGINQTGRELGSFSTVTEDYTVN